MTLVLGLLLAVVGVVLLVLRKRVYRFLARGFPHADHGLMYVWLYIVGPVFLIVLGGTMAISGLRP